jgi:hypothetical protein
MTKRLQYVIAGVMLLLATSLTGQRAAKFWWFDAGIKAQYGATSMFNQTVGDSENWRYDVGTGYSFGGKIGINKGTSGLTIDVMAATGTAQFEDATVPTDVVNTELTYKTLDIYTLYRNNRQLGYVEVGPKFSIMNSAEYGAGGEVVDVTDFYEGNNVNAVLGFGAYFLGSDGAFSGIIGLRFEYGLTDIVNDSGHASGTPVQDLSLDTGASVTHPVFAGISFELNWGLGYYGKASCGGRSKFIKF